MPSALDNLKGIELFDGKTLDQVLKDIYDQSLEERNSALQTFQEFKDMISDPEDLFMNGDKPDKFLDIAQKSTENLIKMVNAAQKLVQDMNEGVHEEAVDVNSLLKRLDEEDIGPERFRKSTEDKKEKKAAVG